MKYVCVVKNGIYSYYKESYNSGEVSLFKLNVKGELKKITDIYRRLEEKCTYILSSNEDRDFFEKNITNVEKVNKK